jgi:hypothetical protein
MLENNQDLENEQNSIVQRSAEEIIRKTKLRYAQGFEAAIHSYRQEVGPFPEKVEEFIRNKGWLEPRFSSFSGVEADEELKRIGYKIGNRTVGEDEILLVHQRPKPLTQFWNKRVKQIVPHEYFGKDSPKQVQLLNGMVIEWGYFVKKLKNTIWNVISEVQDEYGYDLKINRANAIGDHTDDFYYVFLISE